MNRHESHFFFCGRAGRCCGGVFLVSLVLLKVLQENAVERSEKFFGKSCKRVDTDMLCFLVLT